MIDISAHIVNACTGPRGKCCHLSKPHPGKALSCPWPEVLVLDVTMPVSKSTHSGFLLFPTMEESQGGNSREELKQRPWKGAAYVLAPPALLSLLSYKT